MQLPQGAMTSNADVDDSSTTAESILMKAIITDIVRLQGEELIRVRNELEKAQSLNASALELMRVTECRMSELQDTSHQRRLKMLALQETLAEMQTENDDLSNSLEIARERLHVFCRLVGKPSPSGKQEPEMEQQNNNKHSFQDQSVMTEGEDVTSTAAVATAPDQKSTEVMEGVNTTASATAISSKQLSTEAREGEITTSPDQLSTECTSSLPDVVLGPETDISSEYRRSPVDALDPRGAVQQGSLVLKETDRSEPEPFSTGVEQWYTSDPSSLMDKLNGDTDDSGGGNYPEIDVDVVPYLGVSHTLVESDTSQHSTSSGTTQFVTASSLCHLPITLTKLPQNPGDKSKMEQICSEALGYSPTFLEGPYLKHKVVIDLHNQDKGIMFAVSKNDTTPGKLLRKCKTGTRWKQTFIAIDYGGSERNLYILGEYEYRGYPPIKLALSDYNLLPEAAKDFIFDSGRGINKDIKTKEHVTESLVKQEGITIHQIVLEIVRCRNVLEQLIIEEARRMGH